MDNEKSAREHFADAAEGLRLLVCGGFMLGVCGAKAAFRAIRGWCKKDECGKGGERNGGNAAKDTEDVEDIEDVEIVK